MGRVYNYDICSEGFTVSDSAERFRYYRSTYPLFESLHSALGVYEADIY